MTAALFLVSLFAIPTALADASLTGREVLVRGFPDLAHAHCHVASACDMSRVSNGALPLFGNITLTVLEDRGETLLVTYGRGASALEGEVARADVVPTAGEAPAKAPGFDTKIAVLEAFYRQPIPAAKRIEYARKMGERTKAIVSLALDSDKLHDAEVEDFLAQMQREITQGGIPFRDADPSIDKECNDKSHAQPTEAYADIARNPVLIYFCRNAYELETPGTMVHELTHVMQAHRRQLVSDADKECTADLVAMITVYSARLSDPSIPVGWAYHGPYYPTCAPKYHQRFHAFAQAAGIPLNKRDDWDDGSE